MSKKSNKSTAAVRGNMRDNFFAAGGAPSEWLGYSKVQSSPNDRRNSRSNSKNNAIESSLYDDDEIDDLDFDESEYEEF